MTVKLTLDDSDVLAYLDRLTEPQLGNAVGEALFGEAWEIMGKSHREVPVRDGILKNSGTVLPPERRSGSVVVEMGYGGAASAYAVVQHERTDFAHRVGKAKYLEDPLMQAAPNLTRNLTARLRDWIKDQAR